jgi:Glyoxalase/Bleomycin resistance protein/Dioxygenase superfamily
MPDTAVAAVAKYLSGMHARLHPIFGDAFLTSLSKLSVTDEANRPDLSATLGIVLDAEGNLVEVALTRSRRSGTPEIYVDDVRAVGDELVRAGVEIEGDVMDQTWGNLEINLVDPDSNRIVIAQDKGG